MTKENKMAPELEALHAQIEVTAAALDSANSTLCALFDSNEPDGSRLSAARLASVAASDAHDDAISAWRTAWIDAGRPLDNL